MPLILILVECGLELIPKSLREHPKIKSLLREKTYACQLLDNALHHFAMNKLKNYQKRGRPDIVHLCLLNALGSVLNKRNHLELYIHTIKNRIFKFNPEIRIARNYNRFKGLMAKLLIDGHIGTKTEELISPVGNSLKKIIQSYQNPKILVFSRRGKQLLDYRELYTENLDDNIIAIIGGFQKGTYSSQIFNLSKELISLSSLSLDAWVVIYKTIEYYELKHKII
ncbi:MAG: 16S rRNA methyltransferase [Promethearchaeia archaeon]